MFEKCDDCKGANGGGGEGSYGGSLRGGRGGVGGDYISIIVVNGIGMGIAGGGAHEVRSDGRSGGKASGGVGEWS